MKRYEHLEEAMCKELEKLDKKYGTDVAEMSVQDVEKADVLYHALKSAETYYAMKDADEWDDDMEGSGEGRNSRGGRSYYGRGGTERSYRRGRDSMGRYVSRDMDGYSGHYPEWLPPMYPRY